MENYKTKNLADLIEQIHVAETQKLLPQAKVYYSVSSLHFI